MRVYDLPPSILCTKHLVAEHREIHCIYSVISCGKKGYSKHPETLRWVGKLPALLLRHDKVAQEMLRRGFNHKTPLRYVYGLNLQCQFVDTPERQRQILRQKKCLCFVNLEIRNKGDKNET